MNAPRCIEVEKCSWADRRLARASESITLCGAMGTTFVSLSRQASRHDPGFWMVRFHAGTVATPARAALPDPTDQGEHSATRAVREQWLLASRGYFTGCVPHGMEDACLTSEGQAVVRAAVASLLGALQREQAPLDPATLNLLGIDGEFARPIERSWLLDIGHAFLDLLDGKITCVASSTDVMPGSKPYSRSSASG